MNSANLNVIILSQLVVLGLAPVQVFGTGLAEQIVTALMDNLLKPIVNDNAPWSISGFVFAAVVCWVVGGFVSSVTAWRSKFILGCFTGVFLIIMVNQWHQWQAGLQTLINVFHA